MRRCLLATMLVEWTAARLVEAGVEYFFAGHCTGLEPVHRFRALMGARSQRFHRRSRWGQLHPR